LGTTVVVVGGSVVVVAAVASVVGTDVSDVVARCVPSTTVSLGTVADAELVGVACVVAEHAAGTSAATAIDRTNLDPYPPRRCRRGAQINVETVGLWVARCASPMGEIGMNRVRHHYLRWGSG
jgi:hypothetical protein